MRRGIAILQHGTPAQIASAEKGELSMTNIADEVTAMIFPEPEKSGRGKKGRSGKGRGFRGVYRAADSSSAEACGKGVRNGRI